MNTTDDIIEDDDVEEYVNEDCPNGCNEEHDVWHDGDEFTCTATGDVYAYCYGCGMVNLTGRRWRMYMYEGPDGHQYCEGCQDWGSCDECGEPHWYDDLTSDEYGDYLYCHSCYRENSRNGSYDDSPGESIRTCPDCSTAAVFMDLLTEELVCRHEGEARQARKVPVLEVAA